MTCPPADRLAAHLDGELSENDARSLKKHLSDCSACAASAGRLAELAGALASATAGRADDAFVREVRARLQRRPRRRLPYAVGATMAIAASAALLIVGVDAGAPGAPEGTLTPRGGAARLEQQVGFSAFLHPGSAADSARPIAPADRIRPGDGLSFELRNRSGRGLYAMVFAVDASGQTHWLHPAWTNASEDPSSVLLAHAPAVHPPREGITPEDLRRGPLTVYGLFTEHPLRVSAIEAALRDRGPSGLKAVASGAVIHTLSVVVEDEVVSP